VAAYFQSQEQAEQFITGIAELKELEYKSLEFDDIDKKSKLSYGKGEHPVIPSTEELGRYAISYES